MEARLGELRVIGEQDNAAVSVLTLQCNSPSHNHVQHVRQDGLRPLTEQAQSEAPTQSEWTEMDDRKTEDEIVAQPHVSCFTQRC